jgi:hypothetical protein
MKKALFYDIEIFKNYFEIGFLWVDDNSNEDKYYFFEIKNRDVSIEDINKLTNFLNDFYERGYNLVGFNNYSFDDPLFRYILKEPRTLKQIYLKAHELINGEFNLNEKIPPHLNYATIDIYKIANGLTSGSPKSLKMFGAMLGLKIEELPIRFDKRLTAKEMQIIKEYNKNDLIITKTLYNHYKKHIILRHEVNLKENGENFYSFNSYNRFKDYRNKGNASFGISLLKTFVKTTNKRFDIDKSFKIKFPQWLHNYIADEEIKKVMQQIEKHKFRVNSKSKQPIKPHFLKNAEIKINGLDFEIGIGGLHSQENNIVIDSRLEDNLKLMSIDVTSYYPIIILYYQLAPIGVNAKSWLETISTLFNKRVLAKKTQKRLEKLQRERELSKSELKELNEAKLINAVYKIILNGGVYGKLGDYNSFTYDPSIMTKITLYGQFMLLGLIEKLNNIDGVEVFSSNTDGIEIKINKTIADENKINKTVLEWEILSGMTMERDEYIATYIDSVNHYLQLSKGGVKAKGSLSLYEINLQKSLTYPIVYKAIKNYVQDFIPIEKTIKSEEDLINFCSAKKISGGAFITNVNPNEFKKYLYGKKIKKDENGNIKYRLIPKNKREKINGLDILDYYQSLKSEDEKKAIYHKVYNINTPMEENILHDGVCLDLSKFDSQDVGSTVRFIYTKKYNADILNLLNNLKSSSNYDELFFNWSKLNLNADIIKAMIDFKSIKDFREYIISFNFDFNLNVIKDDLNINRVLTKHIKDDKFNIIKYLSYHFALNFIKPISKTLYSKKYASKISESEDIYLLQDNLNNYNFNDLKSMIDYDRYISIAYKILNKLGIN